MTHDPINDSFRHRPDAARLATYAKRGIVPVRLRAILNNASHRVLDVGCGSGAYVLSLAEQYDIHGMDRYAYDAWQNRPELFFAGDIRSIPLADNSFETVTAFEIFEHIADPLVALRECYRVCSRNLILTVPNCDKIQGMEASMLIYCHYQDPTHVNYFTLDAIARLVEKAGFRLTVCTLTNEINIMPLVKEAYNLSGLAGKIVCRWLQHRKRRSMMLNCFIVAEKENGLAQDPA